MRRRSFLKSGLVFTGLIWVPKASAQLNIGNPFFVGGVLKPAAAGGGCGTESHTQGGGFDDFADFTFYTWFASSFTAPSTFDCCKIQWRLSKLGTVAAGTLQAKIYTNSAGNPGTLVGTASDTIDRTTVTAEAWYDFANVAASLVNGTAYWAVIQASSVDTNGSNCVLNLIDTTSETATNKGSTDGSAWDFLLSNRSYGFKLFSA